MNVLKLLKNSSPRILIIGDVFLDHYVYYDPKLGSPSLETSLKPVVAVREEFLPGGAGNVAKAFTLLGATVDLVGTIGNDGYGLELVRTFEKLGIKTENLVRTPERSTLVYTKLVNVETEKEDLPRLDIIPRVFLHADTVSKIIDRLKRTIQWADAVVVVDQIEEPGLGIITKEVKSCLDELRTSFQDKIFAVDSRIRPHIFSGYILKPNLREFIKTLYALHINEDLDNTPAQILVQRHAVKISELLHSALTITASEDGSYVVENKKLFRIFPMPSKVVDVCGAGDSFMAAFIMALLTQEKSSIIKAAALGTKAAGICVSQRGTGMVKVDDLLEAGSPRSDEVVFKEFFINIPVKHSKIKFALFDFDGTISLLREGWQSIMKPIMIKAITGGKKLSDMGYRRLEKAVEDYIDRTTGQQTILQMQGLEKMVREYGFVSEDEIKTPVEYKALYNKELKKIVRRRLQEGNPSKYLLKGAYEFIEALHNMGIVLLLASGTDIEDVKEEARFLGIHDFFTGGVYGALRNYKEYSKEKVIRNLIVQNDLKGEELLVVGDGPVEVSIGKKVGGLTIGVASNEKRGYGWNLRKFQRLKECGSNLLIPDFTLRDDLIFFISNQQIPPL